MTSPDDRKREAEIREIGGLRGTGRLGDRALLLRLLDESRARCDHIKQVEFPERIEKVSAAWRAKVEAAESRCEALTLRLSEAENDAKVLSELADKRGAASLSLERRCEALTTALREARHWIVVSGAEHPSGIVRVIDEALAASGAETTLGEPKMPMSETSDLRKVVREHFLGPDSASGAETTGREEGKS